MIFIPEITIKQIVDSILLYIRTNYNSTLDKDKSYLALLIKGLKLGKFDIYEQAVEIFVNRGRNHPKQLEVHHFFNLERAAIPTIHIGLTNDDTGPNGIGIDQGFNEDIYDSTNQTIKEVYNRAFDSRISLTITSENSLEVITIYHVLRAALISTFNELQFAGMQNPKITGGDLQINPDLVPAHIFFRVLHIDYFYDVPAPTIFTRETYADIVAQGIAINQSLEIDESSSN